MAAKIDNRRDGQEGEMGGQNPPALTTYTLHCDLTAFKEQVHKDMHMLDKRCAILEARCEAQDDRMEKIEDKIASVEAKITGVSSLLADHVSEEREIRITEARERHKVMLQLLLVLVGTLTSAGFALVNFVLERLP